MPQQTYDHLAEFGHASYCYSASSHQPLQSVKRCCSGCSQEDMSCYCIVNREQMPRTLTVPVCASPAAGWLVRMATNERSMEEFQAVHNIILETLRVRC